MCIAHVKRRTSSVYDIIYTVLLFFYRMSNLFTLIIIVILSRPSS